MKTKTLNITEEQMRYIVSNMLNEAADSRNVDPEIEALLAKIVKKSESTFFLPSEQDPMASEWCKVTPDNIDKIKQFNSYETARLKAITNDRDSRVPKQPSTSIISNEINPSGDTGLYGDTPFQTLGTKTRGAYTAQDGGNHSGSTLNVFVPSNDAIGTNLSRFLRYDISLPHDIYYRYAKFMGNKKTTMRTLDDKEITVNSRDKMIGNTYPKIGNKRQNEHTGIFIDITHFISNLYSLNMAYVGRAHKPLYYRFIHEDKYNPFDLLNGFLEWTSNGRDWYVFVGDSVMNNVTSPLSQDRFYEPYKLEDGFMASVSPSDIESNTDLYETLEEDGKYATRLSTTGKFMTIDKVTKEDLVKA